MSKHGQAAALESGIKALAPTGQTLIMQLNGGKWLVRFLRPDPAAPNKGTYSEGFGNSLIEALAAAGM